jgi:hypothetical protein
LQDHQPRIEAGSGGEERRQAAVEPLVEQQRRPPLADRTPARHGQLREVERQRDGLAVEVAAADHEPAAGRGRALVGRASLGEDERVVGRAVHLDVEHPPEMVERVADGAVDLRHAAQRVGILDLVGEALVARLERGIAEDVAQLRGDGDLAGWGRASW